MSDRQHTIDFEMDYCQHYKPVFGSRRDENWCLKGMDIQKVTAGQMAPTPLRPCIAGHTMDNPIAACPHWIRRTRAMGEARADRVEKSMAIFDKVMPVVKEWRTWSLTNKASKQGVIDCPTGCGGKLHLSQAAYNGHVRGQCTTEGCAAWVE